MSAIEKRIHEAAIRIFAARRLDEVSVSELAQTAGVARGTVYKNLESIDSLFENVASQLAAEMNERVELSAAPDLDPAMRLANGIRFYIRCAHEEPHWGRFLVRYSATSISLQKMWEGPPVRDVLDGLSKHRFSFRPEQTVSVIAMIAGSVLIAVALVLEGHKTWGDAGSDTAELVLRALGMGAGEARSLSTALLPSLPALD